MNVNLKRVMLVAFSAVLIPNVADAFYAAHMGRWTSRDPRGDVMRVGMEVPPDAGHQMGFVERDQFDPTSEYDDGMNLYQYVQSNPVTAVDPQGLGRDSVSVAIERCLKLPYPANIKCLDDLLGSGYKDKAIRGLQCELVHQAYKTAGANCRACVPTMTKKELLANAACFTAEVTIRARYLSMNCDCILPGSIARGSDKAKKGHQQELAQKSAAAAACYALAAKAKK